MGLRVFDLASFKSGVEGREGPEEVWKEFLISYQESRKFGEADSKLLDTFVAIRHVWWIALRCGDAHYFGHEDSGKLFVQRQIRYMLESFLEKN